MHAVLRLAIARHEPVTSTDFVPDLEAASPDSAGGPPSEDTEASASRKSRVLRRAGMLGLELVVVFAGVYAAFLLSAYQQTRKDDARRTAIYEVLLAEAEQTADFARWYQSYFETNYAEPMLQPYERGERPPIYGLWLPTARQSGTWTAMLEAGVDLLDPAFIQQVEAHRSRVQFMIDQTDRAVRLSDEKIEPVPSQDDFYGPDGRLRKPYRWYPRLLGYLSGNAVNVEASADSLQTAIRLRIEAEK